MNTTHDPRSVGTLVTDLVQQMATLLQTEARLFRAEMNEKLQQAINGAGELIGGAVLLLAALLVLLQALVVGLSELGLGPGWASLIVSVWMLGGLSVASIGLLGLYIARIFIETKRRPYSIVRARYGYPAKRHESETG